MSAGTRSGKIPGRLLKVLLLESHGGAASDFPEHLSAHLLLADEEMIVSLNYIICYIWEGKCCPEESAGIGFTR